MKILLELWGMYINHKENCLAPSKSSPIQTTKINVQIISEFWEPDNEVLQLNWNHQKLVLSQGLARTVSVQTPLLSTLKELGKDCSFCSKVQVTCNLLSSLGLELPSFWWEVYLEDVCDFCQLSQGELLWSNVMPHEKPHEIAQRAFLCLLI